MSVSTYVTSTIQKQSVSHRWQTHIQETIQGYEKRSALLTWPRVGLDNELRFITSTERNFIRSSLHQNLHNTWAFPFVHDQTKLTSQASSGQKILTLESTSDRHFYNGRTSIIVNPSNWKSYEFCTIDTVDTATQITLLSNLSSTWAVNSKVYPCYEYRIGEAQDLETVFRQLNTLNILATECFEDLRSFSYTLPSSGAAVYNGLDLFLTKPLYPITETFAHPYTELSFLGLGYAATSYTQTRTALEFEFIITPRSAIWDVLNFFDSKRGRFQSFYIPSWNDDIIPTAAIGSASTTITVEQIYLTSAEIVGRYLYIRLPDGSYVCRSVTGLATSTSLQISSGIGTAVSQSNLSKMLICFLPKVRFNADEIMLDFISNDIAKTKLGFQSVL